jgi:hypothetical protein
VIQNGWRVNTSSSHIYIYQRREQRANKAKYRKTPDSGLPESKYMIRFTVK